MRDVDIHLVLAVRALGGTELGFESQPAVFLFELKNFRQNVFYFSSFARPRLGLSRVPAERLRPLSRLTLCAVLKPFPKPLRCF
jgi:hypothetical protein